MTPKTAVQVCPSGHKVAIISGEPMKEFATAFGPWAFMTSTRAHHKQEAFQDFQDNYNISMEEISHGR